MLYLWNIFWLWIISIILSLLISDNKFTIETFSIIPLLSIKRFCGRRSRTFLKLTPILKNKGIKKVPKDISSHITFLQIGVNFRF